MTRRRPRIATHSRALPPVRTAAVCPQEHHWPITMVTTQHLDADGSVVRNEFQPCTPACPTCSQGWIYVDSAAWIYVA